MITTILKTQTQTESLAHTIEGQLKEHGSKLEAGDKSAIEDAVSAVRKALEGDDIDTISSTTATLEQSAMKLGEVIYKDQQAGGDEATAGAGSSDAEGSDDDIVDADFEEVDDDKK